MKFKSKHLRWLKKSRFIADTVPRLFNAKEKPLEVAMEKKGKTT